LADLWRRHFLDSAQVLKHVPVDASSWLDIGTGAGFPGVVLAILGASDVHLVESDLRKCAFLHEVLRATATTATVHAVRIDALVPRPFSVVTARALARLGALIGLAAPFLGPNSCCLFLKGQDVAQELTEAHKCWNIVVDRFKSVTDPNSTVLRLTGIHHVNR